jgi:hypothetical protein
LLELKDNEVPLSLGIFKMLMLEIAVLRLFLVASILALALLALSMACLMEFLYYPGN